ncbi:MAG TPA: hypothetical protein VIM08_01250 [Arthrobacter sp.]
MIPAKPSSKDNVACVGELAGGVLIGCSRRPLKFVVGIAPKGFGLGEVEDAEYPAIKVCGACSRHVDALAAEMAIASPESHRTEPMIFTLGGLLEVWDDFFGELLSTVGGEWEADGQFR